MTRINQYLGLVMGAALLLGLLAGTGNAAGPTTKVSVALNRDGSGQLIANTDTTAGSVTWTWQACDVNGDNCAPIASGQSMSTAGAGPNTVFKATASNGVTATSPIWHGVVAAVAPPSVSGAIRGNSLVTPQLATWTGGWDGDFDRTQLAACSGRSGTGCTSLTSLASVQSCPNGGAVIDPAFVGRYLRVADERDGANTSFPDLAVSSTGSESIWPAAPLTAVAIVGRIAAATGPRSASCGPPPLKATGALTARGMATVACPQSCRVSLLARRGQRHLALVRKLGRFGSLSLNLGQIATKRLGAGTLALALYVDGNKIAGRTIHAR